MSHILAMAISLPISRMSREDKLRAMEELWADLSQDEGGTDSPGWHGEVLRETEQLVRDGKAKFSDWRDAKRRISRKASRTR
jgi:hypothetical protein